MVGENINKNKNENQTDKYDICMGNLNILISFIKIDSHDFAIYAHISPIMLGFGLFGF